MSAQVLMKRTNVGGVKLLQCLSAKSSKCKGVFKTTIERRICNSCTLNIGRGSQESFEETDKEDDELAKFWKGLK